MNKKLNLFFASALAFAGAMTFVACGGDSGTSSKDKNAEINEYEKLPSCSTKNEAERAVIEDEETVYVCNGGNWDILDTEFVAKDTVKTFNDMPECSEDLEGESFYVKKTGVNYICEDERWEIAIVKEESSSSSAKGDPDKAKSSSSSEVKDVAETLDDLPNCTSKREGSLYHVTEEKSDFICSENRIWEKVESCGGKNIISATHFCADGKAYEKCDGKAYDPAKNFCADEKVYSLCGGKEYDVTTEECVDGKIEDQVRSVFSCESPMGNFDAYIKNGKTHYVMRYSGNFTNYEGGCLYQAQEQYEATNEMVEMLKGKTRADLKKAASDMDMPLAFLVMFANSEVVLDVDSCDYFFTLDMVGTLSDEYTEDDLKVAVGVVSSQCSEHEYDEGDYKNCREYDGSKKSILTNIETQFCYEGAVYDRCGGSTFATSKPYDPTLYSCVDGKVVGKSEGTICGGKEFDPVYQRCESGVIVRNVQNESSVTNAYGYEKVYSVGDSAYSDLIMFGEVLNNKETGCYEYGVGLAAAINETAEIVLPDPAYSKEMRNFFAYGKAEIFIDSCDYYARYTRKVKIPEGYSFEEFKTGSNEFYAAMLNEQNVKLGLYEPSPDGKIMCGEDAAATVMDAEKQFCYSGIVYDRCGGSSFASSVIFYPEIQSCVGGEVVAGAAKPLCGAESYDPKNTLCVGGKLYDKGLYELCSKTVVAKKSSEFCFEGSAYAASEYELCSETVIAEKSIAFCYEGEPLSREEWEQCGEGVANKTSEFCLKGKAYAKDTYEICGEGVMNKTSEFCLKGKAYAKDTYEICGEGVMNKTSEFCLKGKAYAKDTYEICGEGVMNKTSEFCLEGKAYAKDTYEICGEAVMDKNEKFCLEGEAYPLCNGKSYTPKAGGSCSNGNYYYSDGLTKYFQDLRDGNVYPYVNVGTQTWLAKNLNYAVENSKCNGGDCSEFGRYYTWADAMSNECTNSATCDVSGRVQGVCPDGWHIPSASEAQTLVTNIGDNLTKYRSTSGWNTSVGSSKGNGTDAYGLNLLPSAYLSDSQSELSSGMSGWSGSLWTSTQRDDSYSNTYAQSFYYHAGDDNASVKNREKANFLPVRCIKTLVKK